MRWDITWLAVSTEGEAIEIFSRFKTTENARCFFVVIMRREPKLLGKGDSLKCLQHSIPKFENIGHQSSFDRFDDLISKLRAVASDDATGLNTVLHQEMASFSKGSHNPVASTWSNCRILDSISAHNVRP